MSTDESRRRFLKKLSGLGVSCFSLAMWYSHSLAYESDQDETGRKVEAIDLKKRSYCGIACESECELFKATRENDVDLKKKVFDEWNWKEEFGVEFDPDQVFCYHCKPENKIYKTGMIDCKVRKCAIQNKLESCIECKNLSSCDQEFWNKWPKFYDHVIQLQKQYMHQKGSILKDISKS